MIIFRAFDLEEYKNLRLEIAIESIIYISFSQIGTAFSIHKAAPPDSVFHVSAFSLLGTSTRALNY